MKNCFLILIALLYFVSTVLAQANEEKSEVLNFRDDAERYAWRTKTGNWANSGGDVYPYPAMYLYWGKGMSSDGLAKITVDGKSGFIDKRGKIVIRPTFKDSGWFSNGLAPVELDNGKWGFINTKGKFVVEPVYDWAFGSYSAHDLARVQLNDKWGYINGKGELVIKPQFDDAGVFREGLAAVKIKGKWGFIDASGVQIVAAQFSRAFFFSEGRAAVAIEIPAPLPGFPNHSAYKWGFIDKIGKWAIEPSWDLCSAFYEGMAWAHKNVGKSTENSQMFLIDHSGKVLWDESLFRIRSYDRDMMVIRTNGAKGFTLVDRNGTRVTDRLFDDIGHFSEGLLIARDGEKYGFINKSGEFVISPKFDFAMYFREGLALVQQGKKYGFIDAKGKFTIDPAFEYAWPFGNGFALVIDGEKTGYIDKTGKYLWKPTK